MCQLCETKPVYEFTNKRKLCKTCFIRWFQKKVLYTNRKFNLINSGDIIGYEKAESFQEVVLEDVLKIFENKGFVEIVELPIINKIKSASVSESKLKINKIAVSQTTDSETNKIIKEIIKGNIKKIKEFPIEKNIIKPLYLFLDEEVLLYAKILGLKFKRKVEKKDKIKIFVDELEKKHPEVKRAVINGYLKLYNDYV